MPTFFSRIFSFDLVFVLTLGLAGWTSLVAETVEVGRSVPASRQVAMDKIDHSAWDTLLQKYVDDRGRVDYRGWKASRQDMQRLDHYLETLSTASRRVRSSRAAQLAFWINAYNAVTIRGILREYPTTSIRNHTAKVWGYNIWKNLLLHVGDTTISLNDMEHEVLRKMGEPRIHFAIVCASHSCPRLLNRAYVADKLEDQLATNTRNFFSNPGNFRYDAGRNTFLLSSILKWFAEDFGATTKVQLRTIAPYLPDRAAQAAARRGTVRVQYLDYDWSLNEQPR